MNKIILLSLLVSMFSLAKAEDLKTQTRDIGTFTSITTTKGINVTLVKGDKESILVKIQNGLVSDVVTSLKGRDLKVTMKSKVYNKVAVHVYITYKNLIEVTAGTGSSIDAEGSINADELTLRASMGSSLTLNINAKTLKASSVSSSKMELTGRVNYQEVSAFTGGKYTADKLESNDAFVKAATKGIARVRANRKLEMRTNTGGKIIYHGNPSKVTSKGNVEKVD